MQQLTSRMSSTRLQTPSQGAPRAEVVAAWSGQTAKSPRRARATRQVLPLPLGDPKSGKRMKLGSGVRQIPNFARHVVFATLGGGTKKPRVFTKCGTKIGPAKIANSFEQRVKTICFKQRNMVAGTWWPKG